MDIATGIINIYNTNPTWPNLPMPSAGGCSVCGSTTLISPCPTCASNPPCPTDTTCNPYGLVGCVVPDAVPPAQTNCDLPTFPTCCPDNCNVPYIPSLCPTIFPEYEIHGYVTLCSGAVCECGAAPPRVAMVPASYIPTLVSNQYYKVSTANSCYFKYGFGHGVSYDRNKFPNFKMFIRNNDADTVRISVAAILIFKRKYFTNFK